MQRGGSASSSGLRQDRRRRRAAASPNGEAPPRHGPKKRDRREEVDAAGKRIHRRSRSGRRRRSSAAAPPVDWRGPASLELPPPPDWRGPGDIPREWRGPHGLHDGPPGFYPPPRPGALPWFAEHPPPRPLGYSPPLSSLVHQPGPPSRPDYGWHLALHGRPEDASHFRGEPPMEWRGPGLQRGFSGSLDAAGAAPPWQSSVPGPLGPPGAMPWGAGPCDAAAGYPSYRGSHAAYGRDGTAGDMDKGYEASPTAPSRDGLRAASGLSAGGTGAAGGLPTADVQPSKDARGGGAAVSKSSEDGEARDDELPAPPSVAERLRDVVLVRSALSERMLARLRAVGVSGDSPARPPLSTSGITEVGASGEAPAAVAAVQAQCSRLGLDSGPRARLPPPMPGPARLPACTVGLAQHAGLWERFRQRCGAPVPAEAPPIPCQLRSSAGGGHVVAPLLLLTGASVCT